jgi:hypothetical protein
VTLMAHAALHLDADLDGLPPWTDPELPAALAELRAALSGALTG